MLNASVAPLGGYIDVRAVVVSFSGIEKADENFGSGEELLRDACAWRAM